MLCSHLCCIVYIIAHFRKFGIVQKGSNAADDLQHFGLLYVWVVYLSGKNSDYEQDSLQSPVVFGGKMDKIIILMQQAFGRQTAPEYNRELF